MKLISHLARLAAGLLPLVSTALGQTPFSPRSGATPFEYVADFIWSGRADLHEGSRRLGETDSTHLRALGVATLPLNGGTSVLLGAGVQQFTFSSPAGSLAPDRLGSLALKLGVNHQFDPQWSLRVEADPGQYEHGFGAPIAVRGIYAVSRELQWAFGLNYDWRSAHPIVGGIGVRWQFAPDWTLSLLIPAPRVEWALSKEFSLYAGASLRGGTFRVADNFGRTRGRPAFDAKIVDYREIALGAGARWKLTPDVSAHLGVGAMLDRRFEYDSQNLLLNGDGAPTAQFTISGSF